ncbi:hypothetical protein NLX83_20790 [Allokutzneria sp. A3M-2-11 16]|uniref:hypothetical protein n=1 Tax=Allokutzneria sp. A3M-2-11 16 TaxID=2962043 RepID=UPI0020B7BDC1|nr:hypothetical protein [Allokutzneria sp. A3M-2-11 16]MCP3801704.1 hypothetical protein [Allokutzneria sp. A3M-2-11 16]
MSAPKAPGLPTDHAELRERLLRLYEESGRPSYKAMDTAARTYGVALARATLSDLRNEKYRDRRNGWDVVKAVVVGCLLCRGETDETVSEELERWQGWWLHVSVEAGEFVNRKAAKPEPESETEPEPERKRRWLARRWRVLAACTACFALGTATGVVAATWEQGPDPSLAYGPCGESLARSGKHGSTVLLADTGPHGKPVMDRLIELRVQVHPEHGWIAWARLEKSASDVDRVWLDWSYFRSPNDQSGWRQCGAQPISQGRETPAMLIRDAGGRERWFRACGQAPYWDRAPDHSGTFCTSWTRPRT